MVGLSVKKKGYKRNLFYSFFLRPPSGSRTIPSLSKRGTISFEGPGPEFKTPDFRAFGASPTDPAVPGDGARRAILQQVPSPHARPAAERRRTHAASRECARDRLVPGRDARATSPRFFWDAPKGAVQARMRLRTENATERRKGNRGRVQRPSRLSAGFTRRVPTASWTPLLSFPAPETESAPRALARRTRCRGSRPPHAPTAPRQRRSRGSGRPRSRAGPARQGAGRGRLYPNPAIV